jgi:hypothetical protein
LRTFLNPANINTKSRCWPRRNGWIFLQNYRQILKIRYKRSRKIVKNAPNKLVIASTNPEILSFYNCFLMVKSYLICRVHKRRHLRQRITLRCHLQIPAPVFLKSYSRRLKYKN